MLPVRPPRANRAGGSHCEHYYQLHTCAHRKRNAVTGSLNDHVDASSYALLRYRFQPDSRHHSNDCVKIQRGGHRLQPQSLPNSANQFLGFR